MSSCALLFPGQGSQYVGMAESFLPMKTCSELVSEVEDILSLPLIELMLHGPIDQLTQTKIAQPAILLHSIAAFTMLKNEMDVTAICALGHSLGEYSALVAAEVISFADAIKAVHLRGQLMQEAVPQGLGAMAAVIGMNVKALTDALLEFDDENSDEYVTCANFNGPMQTVIAGTAIGVEKATKKLSSLGARRIVPLPVSAPFHCALMKPVQKQMADALAKIPFSDPKFPLISNVSANQETKGERIKQLLLEQITAPVRFTDCIDHISQHQLTGEHFLELGPKNILSAMIKKIDKNFKTKSIDQISDLKGLKE